MTEALDPDRLKELRKRSNLTQDKLGKDAKINKQTIYRLETGRHRTTRPMIINRLAKALGVSADVLTGQDPLPAVSSGADRTKLPKENDYPINVRVDGAVRNAFSLTARRYGIPITRIVELAPFLFVVAAEASLERRRAKLKELKEALGQAGALAEEFLHLPNSIRPEYSAEGALHAENESIEAQDIMAANLPDNVFGFREAIEPNYDESKHNPFVRHLKEVSPVSTLASLHSFNRSSTDFEVCREDALKLAGCDNDLADSIVAGVAMLHEMPRELFGRDADEQRAAWLQEKWRTYRDSIFTLDDLFNDAADGGKTP